MTVTLRALTPGRVPEIVPIHMHAFSGYINAKLGRRYVSAFLRWFASHPEGAIGLVAELPGHRACAGYVVGVDLGLDRAVAKALQPEAALGLLRRPWLFLEQEVRAKLRDRAKMLLRPEARLAVAPPDLPNPIMGLISIGVSPKAQGNRVGAHLMEAFEREARRRGYAAMLLSVYPDNERARRLYEAQGWTTPPGDPFGGRALYYAKTLDPVD